MAWFVSCACSSTSVIFADALLQTWNVRGHSSHRHYWTISSSVSSLPSSIRVSFPHQINKEISVIAGKTRGVITQRSIEDSFSGGESDKEAFSRLSYRTMKTFCDQLILSLTPRMHSRLFLPHTPCRQTSFLFFITWYPVTRWADRDISQGSACGLTPKRCQTDETIILQNV